MRHQQNTSNLGEVFDMVVKLFQAIGDSITLRGTDFEPLADDALYDLILPASCSTTVEMLLLLLRALGAPRLEETFSSVWQASSKRRKQLLKNLQECQNRVFCRESEAAVQAFERNRLLIMGDLEQSEMTDARRRWYEIKQWLTSADALQNHRDVSKVRDENPESGMWLLKNRTYVAWRSDDVPGMPILWMNGILGAGKTVLISVVVDDCRQDRAVSTAFFYCHHGDLQRTELMPILRALLAQLLHVDHVLLPWCYKHFVGSNQSSLTDENLCKDLLSTLLLSNHRTFLILDGLDECEPKTRRALLNFLDRAIAACESHDPGKLRVMIASRDEDDVRKSLTAAAQISISSSLNEGDLRKYIAKRCCQLHERFEELDQDDIDDIVRSTLHRADGECD